MMRFGWILIVCVIAVAGYFYTNLYLRALPIWLGGEEEVAVHVAAVRKVTGPITLRLKGEIAPVKAIDIISPVAGKLVDVRFKVGDAVRAGAILATIHAGSLAQRITEIEAAIADAEQALKTNEEGLAEAEKQLARQRDFHRQDLIARRDLEEAQSRSETRRAQVEFARAQLSQQQAMLAQARALRSRTRLTAPFSGVISRRLAEPGAVVAESGPILTLTDSGSLRMIADVGATYAKDIRAGMPVKIYRSSGPGQPLAGTVVRVDHSPAGDGQRSAQVEIRAGFVLPDFGPGMAVEAVIVLGRQRESFWVPRAAVLFVEGKSYVNKIAGGRAVRQEVTIGTEQDGQVEITQGVHDGDMLIIDELNLLKPNTRVRLLATGDRRAGREIAAMP